VGTDAALSRAEELFCSCDPELFTDPAWKIAAARACAVCPLADACLQRALRIDAAYLHGEDPYGICGVCGGVWFEPGRMPRHILTAAQQLHDRHLWDAA
jgi:hypothetical protein